MSYIASQYYPISSTKNSSTYRNFSTPTTGGGGGQHIKEENDENENDLSDSERLME